MNHKKGLNLALYWGTLAILFAFNSFADDADNRTPRKIKPWTFLVFAAADNNLRDYAARNIKQMSAIGSNETVNLLVHLDIRLTGSKKITRRYFVEKNNPRQIDISNEKVPMNSGDPLTLISACKWAIEQYPAEKYMLVLWNHGTGIIDPYGRRQLNTNSMFVFNPHTNNFELDRSIGFLDLIEALNSDPKGICWDDTTGDYLTNQKLEFALSTITSHQLKGKKFEIIAFDACLMSMVEVAEITKRYAKIQISSQEVEPGPGWRYDEALAPFAYNCPEPRALASHIVDAFAKAYRPTAGHPGFVDYTQSALDLEMVDQLEQNIDRVSTLLVAILQSEQATTLKSILAASRNRKNLTHFNEPTYVDLHHLYDNLSKNIRATFGTPPMLFQELLSHLELGKNTIKQVVIKSVSGSNLPLARGISIFFPERKIHPSYKKAPFATNTWVNFLSAYLLT